MVSTGFIFSDYYADICSYRIQWGFHGMRENKDILTNNNAKLLVYVQLKC